MNKTITINISGAVFNIEEDAYARLKSYIEKLRTCFSSTEGGDEIVSDIESRIAELFQERISPNKQVITEDDVQVVIEVMGQPEDYMDEEDSEPTDSTSDAGSTRIDSRKFYRDPDDHILGGVCSGISQYLGWDPVILRLLFALSVIFGGVGVIAYIILWIIIPGE